MLGLLDLSAALDPIGRYNLVCILEKHVGICGSSDTN